MPRCTVLHQQSFWFLIFVFSMGAGSFGPRQVSGAEWAPIPLSPEVDRLSAMAPGSQYLFAAMWDADLNSLGLYRTEIDSPTSWELLGFEGVGVYSILIVSENDQELFVAANTDSSDIFYSSDGGMTWEPRTDGVDLSRIRLLDWNGGNPGVLYAVAEDEGDPNELGVFASDDRGLSWRYWEYCSGCMTSLPQIAIPRDGGAKGWMVSYTGFMQSWVYRTANSGNSWLWIPESSDEYPLDMAVNPLDPDELLILMTFSYIWHWQDLDVDGIGTPFDVNTAFGLVMPRWDPGMAYVAGLSDDLLDVQEVSTPWSNWNSIREGLPDDPSAGPQDEFWRFSLEASPSRPILALHAGDAGLFVLDLGEVVSVESIGDSAGPGIVPTEPSHAGLVPSGLSWERRFPVPITEDAAAWFRLRSPITGVVHIHDVLGRTISTSPSQRFAAGVHELRWRELVQTDLDDGVYFIVVGGDEARISQRIVLVH